MNSYKLFIISSLFFISSVFSQIITFEKTFTQFNTGFFSAKEADNDGYYLNGIGFYAKTDLLGNIEWYKETNPTLKNEKYFNDFCVNENGIVALENSDVDGISIPVIVAISKDGNEIKFHNFNTSGLDEIACSIVDAPNGYYALTHQNSDTLNVYELNGSFKVIRVVKFPLTYFSISVKIGLTKTESGDYIIWGDRGIIKTDSELNEIWTYQASQRLFDLKEKNGQVYFGAGTSLYILDANANLINNFAVGRNCKAILPLDDKIVIAGYTNIKSYDTTGQLIDENSHRGLSKLMSLISTADSGILLAGSLENQFNKGIMVKTDSGLGFNSLDLLFEDIGLEHNYPNHGKIFPSFYVYNLTWYSNLEGNLDLYFSSDNGSNWELFAENVDAGKGEAKWPIPNLITTVGKIKIVSSTNPDIVDISEPLIIQPYQSYDYIAANEVKMWIGNNGDGSHDPRTGGNGFYWPGGDDAVYSSIFEDGLVWGGKINGQIYFNGNTHRQGLKPGYIKADGTPSSPKAISSKIFKLKKGWEQLPAGQERDRYEYDYNNWPMELNAPFEDVNEDGVYTAGVDKPKYMGDETLFYVANDLDVATTNFTYGSFPIGLEFRTITWAHNLGRPLSDAVFKKYTIHNKSENEITDMYLGYWTDDDLGDAGDDYVGCDTLLNLGFAYNADEDDFQYRPPAAVGHMFVQTPIIAGTSTDSAYYNGSWIKGYKNLPIAGFSNYLNGDPFYHDAAIGRPEGAIEFYNNLLGMNYQGSPYIDPTTNEPTKFTVPGDPVTQQGWYMGLNGWPTGQGGGIGGDMRYVISTGPFNLAPGEKQEITICIFMSQGTSRLNSVTKLKEAAVQLQEFYYGDNTVSVKEPENKLSYNLSQNYPNPFNPETKINYTIPRSGNVKIEVFNMLGQKVKTLVNTNQNAGYYEITFSGKGLASGMYFYRINAGEFIQTKKMLLIK